jgi:HEAT repeat protein
MLMSSIVRTTCRAMVLLKCLTPFCVGQNVNTTETNRSEAERARKVKERIQSIIQATLKEGEFTTAEGIKATTRVPPSVEHVEEVKQLGESAIPVLAAYIGSESPREQELAMRFLAGFGGDRIVEPLRVFAKHSMFPPNRAQAVLFLGQAPLSKALPIIEDVSKTDPDPYVRKTAAELFIRYSEAR